MQSKTSYRERLLEVIELSYKLLCNKVAEGSISIPNEASFQLQLGTIMKIVGQLYEFHEKDHFIINLEAPQAIAATAKSQKGKARCDIELSFRYGNTCKAKAYIELKHFRKSPNAATTDNRFALFKDLKNLEKYKSKADICCEMVFSNDGCYTVAGKSKIDIGNGVTSPKTIVYTSNKSISLDNEYPFNWDSYSDDCHFLKILF